MRFPSETPKRRITPCSCWHSARTAPHGKQSEKHTIELSLPHNIPGGIFVEKKWHVYEHQKLDLAPGRQRQKQVLCKRTSACCSRDRFNNDIRGVCELRI